VRRKKNNPWMAGTGPAMTMEGNRRRESPITYPDAAPYSSSSSGSSGSGMLVMRLMKGPLNS
jgi:hypothetical protein